MNHNGNPNPVALFFIPTALTAGILFFACVVMFMQSGSDGFQSEDPSQTSLITKLSLIHGAVAIVLAFLSHWIYSKLIARVEKPDLQGYLRALVIKFGLLEGGALLGLVVVFLADGDILSTTPAFYLNYLSSAYMVFEFIRFIPVMKKMHASLT